MAMITELSGNEIYCLSQKDFQAGPIVIGNCINTLGLSDKLESTLKGILGQPLQSLTKMLYDGRLNAHQRMMAEAPASSIIKVNNSLLFHRNYLEFYSSGCVVNPEKQSAAFSASTDGKQFFILLDAGYTPVTFVFGNIAYATAFTGGLVGKFKAFNRGEVKHLTETFTQTRRQALTQLIQQAQEKKANAIVGVKTTTLAFSGVNEMLMTGTAAQHPLFSSTKQIVTSALSCDEIWSLAKMGYAPKQILLSSCVVSLGLIGSIAATFKALYLNEIPELTTLFQQARKTALEMIKRDADAIQAEQVVGVRTMIYHLGNGVFEIFNLGTAIEKLAGIKTLSDQLPLQATKF